MTYSIQLVNAAIAGNKDAFEQLIIHESEKLENGSLMYQLKHYLLKS